MIYTWGSGGDIDTNGRNLHALLYFTAENICFAIIIAVLTWGLVIVLLVVVSLTDSGSDAQFTNVKI